MPVPSEKEGCANRASIDLLVAKSATAPLGADGRFLAPDIAELTIELATMGR